MSIWCDEVFEEKIRFGLSIKQTLFVGHSEFQKVSVVDTEAFGRALLIDDLWMTSEYDEKLYHEMIVHPALCTAPRIARVLVIGGGDGGTVREVLRYPEVEHVDMVEIDAMVIEASKQFLPSIGTAWNDPRLQVHVGDGLAWVARQDLPKYDVILVDGSDPVGPATGLFNEDFYRNCAARLSEQGVLVTQAESPLLHRDVHLDMIRTIGRAVGHAHPYYGPVVLYPSGAWSWIYASSSVAPKSIIDARLAHIEEDCFIYNRELHLGCFAQPNHIRKALRRS